MAALSCLVRWCSSRRKSAPPSSSLRRPGSICSSFWCRSWTVAHLLKHLTAGEFLHMVEGLFSSYASENRASEHRFPEEVHKAGQFGPQLLGAQIVLALSAEVRSSTIFLFSARYASALPGKRTDAAAHHGVFAGGSFTADQMVSLSVSAAAVSPLHLLRRGRQCSHCGMRNAQPAVGAGSPVLDKVRAGKISSP